MELFDLIKVIFKHNKDYDKVTFGEKKKHFFLLNRRFAINFPMQAHVLQHLKIDPAGVIDFWRDFMIKQYKYVPGWMYTKGVKKAVETKEKKTNISESLILEYARVFDVDHKSIREALVLFPNEMAAELKTYEKIMKANK